MNAMMPNYSRTSTVHETMCPVFAQHITDTNIQTYRPSRIVCRVERAIGTREKAFFVILPEYMHWVCCLT